MHELSEISHMGDDKTGNERMRRGAEMKERERERGV